MQNTLRMGAVFMYIVGEDVHLFIVGMDAGFRQFKVSSDGAMKQLKFDAVVASPSAIELQDEKEVDLLDNLTIEYEGKLYYVGRKAIRKTKNSKLSFFADKAGHLHERIKYLAALGCLLGDNEKAEFLVGTGLPVDELGNDALRQQLAERMKGTFTFVFNGKERTVRVPEVYVIAQGAGAYYNHIMDDDAKIQTDRVYQRVVTIDIGFRTTDVVTMERALYRPQESFTLYTGVHNIHAELRRILLKKYRLAKDMVEMDDIVRSASISLGGETISVAQEIAEAVQPYAEKVFAELPLYIHNLNEVDTFLITGGGAALMYDFLSAWLPSPTIMSETPEYDNAMGYRKYMQLAFQMRGHSMRRG